MSSAPSTTKSPSAPSLTDSKRAIDWIEMLSRHQDALRRTIVAQMGSGQADCLDDIMQEVALAAVNSNCPPESDEKILPWLNQIARHKIQDHWRKLQRQQRLHNRLVDTAQEPRVALTPYEWVLKCETRDFVTSALAQLPEGDRQLLLQKYRQEKNCQQIAHEKGLSLKTIEYRLSRARQMLRKILNRDTEPSKL